MGILGNGETMLARGKQRGTEKAGMIGQGWQVNNLTRLASEHQ